MLKLKPTHLIVAIAADVYSISPPALSAFLDWLQPRATSGTIVRTTTQVIGGLASPPVPATP